MKTYWPLFVFLVIIAVVYRNWFGGGPITAPDFPYYFAERLSDLKSVPHSWSNFGASGLGANALPTLPLDSYVHAGVRVLVFLAQIPWNIAVRMLFFWPFLLVGTGSAMLFVSAFAPGALSVGIGTLVYMTNTYILMLAGGGQMGLVLAYAMIPLVLWSVVRKQSALFTVSMSLLLLFDLRFALLTAGIIVLYIITAEKPRRWPEFFRFFLLPGAVIAGIHAFWLYPAIFTRAFGLPAGYENVDWVAYLSWADFSKTFSLLHPNWPENIFGKTYFTRPEFLLIPVIAYSALLASRRRDIGKPLAEDGRKRLLFFSVLGLAGAFLAKGVNPPFGALYSWMFSNLPAFSAFRDPTKFYVFTAVSYSALIPLAIQRIISADSKITIRKKLLPVAYALVTAVWLVTIAPSILSQLAGTFSSQPVTGRFADQENLIGSDTQFGRILAVPWRNRFVFESERHPVLDASGIFKDTDFADITSILRSATSAASLQRLAVKFVVVPDDVGKEIFLKDRTYVPELKNDFIRTLDTLPYLEKVGETGGLTVYKTLFSSALFYESAGEHIVPYVSKTYSAVKYAVAVPAHTEDLTLVFSQSFDPNWKLWDGNKTVQSTKTVHGLNSFRMEKSSSPVSVDVYYSVQQKLNAGSVVSVMSAVAGVALVVISLLGRKTRWAGLVIGIAAASVAGYTAYAQLYAPTGSTGIWWSSAWKEVRNPFSGAMIRTAPAGGSELRFTVRHSSSVSLELSGYDPAHGNGIEVWIGDERMPVIREPTMPVYTVVLRSRKKTFDVRLRTYCSGEPGCGIRVQSVSVEPGGSITKPGGIPSGTVAFLGDSLSAIHGPENASFLVADAMRWQLVNASYNGSTLTDSPGYLPGIRRAKEEIIAIRPDVVFIMLGTNDAIRRVSVAEFSSAYSRLLYELRTDLPESELFAVGLFGSPSGKVGNTDMYNAAIRSAADAAGVEFISVDGLLSARDFTDGLHPSESAQSKIAEKFLGAVAKE